jgi:hypothetical protein
MIERTLRRIHHKWQDQVDQETDGRWSPTRGEVSRMQPTNSGSSLRRIFLLAVLLPTVIFLVDTWDIE